MAASFRTRLSKPVFDDNPQLPLVLAVPRLEPERTRSRMSILQSDEPQSISSIPAASPISSARRRSIACVTSFPNWRRNCRRVNAPAKRSANGRVRLPDADACCPGSFAPQLNGEDHTKDIDFSRAGIRIALGTQAIAMRNWCSPSAALEGDDVDPREGFICTELQRGRPIGRACAIMATRPKSRGESERRGWR